MAPVSPVPAFPAGGTACYWKAASAQQEESNEVLATVNDPRFADLTPSQIVAILPEEEI